MEQSEHLVQQAATLASAAQRLADSAADPSSAPHLAAALGCVGETLDALTRAYEGAAHVLVPTEDRFERIGARFARAAAGWPATHGRESPSHERQAQLLASLHEAGATVRVARRKCMRANDLLLEMTAPREIAAPPSHGASNAVGSAVARRNGSERDALAGTSAGP